MGMNLKENIGGMILMKKRISMLLMVIFTLSIMTFAVGCGQQETAAPEQPAAEQPAAEPAPAPEVDEEAIVADAVKNFLTNQAKDAMVKLDAVKDQMDSFNVIDIRDAEAFGKGHIEGAVNMSKEDLANNLEQLPTDKPILVVCYSGQNASHTAGALRIAGYNAISLIGGMGAWDGAELPTVQ